MSGADRETAGGELRGYRLCVVSDSAEIGGAERFLRHLLAALPAEVDVVALGTSPTVLHEVVADRQRARAVVVDGSVAGYRREMARTSPDIVHLNLTAFTSC